MPHIVDDDEFDLDVDTIDDDVELPEDEAPEPAAESEPESELSKSETPAPEKPVEEDEESIESYSKRVQKRINKLTTKMRQYEKETNYWKERVAALEAKTTAKEIADFQGQIDWSTKELEKQLDSARAAKRAAIEEGDIDKQVKTDDQILELREQLAEKRRLANAAKEQADKLQETPKPSVAPPTTSTSVPDDLPAGTRQWLRVNSWFMKGEHPRAAEMARALDAALQEEGFSPDDPAMYAELDKRLSVAYPRVAKDRGAKAPPPKPKVAGSSADGQRGTETAAPTTSSAKPARKLTHDDLAKMKRYGFDPNSAADRKSWLKRNDPL